MERTAADLFGLTRYPANMGGRLDFGPKGPTEPPFLGQVKNPMNYSLAAIWRIADEMRDAAEYSSGRMLQVGTNTTPARDYHGVAVVKLSNKRPTPHLVIYTLSEWVRLVRLMPVQTFVTMNDPAKKMTLAKLTAEVEKYRMLMLPTRALIVIHEEKWLELRNLLPYDWEIGARKKGATDGSQDQQEPADRVGAVEAEG